MRFTFATMAVAALLVSACGGGGSAQPNAVTLSAGQSATLSSGETAMAPSGFTVKDANGSSYTVTGHLNTLNVSAGAVVTVSPTASGAADNAVVAK